SINELQALWVLVSSLRCNETFDVTEQLPPRRIDVVRPVRADDFAQRLRNDAEERDEQFAWCSVGVVRGNFRSDHAEVAGAFSGKVQDRLDGERQHRT